MRFVCTGELAYLDRVRVDLDCDPRDRRLVIVRSDEDVRRLRGLFGDDILWVSMGSTPLQTAMCWRSNFTRVSIEEARAGLAQR
jgi:hypothetical protein